MKLSIRLSILLYFFTIAWACKKPEEQTPVTTNAGFVKEIQKIVSQPAVNDLKNRGMNINAGNNPPKISGIYSVNPYELLSPYGVDDDFKKGKITLGYRYKFYNQSSDNSTINFDYTNYLNDKGDGSGTTSYVSGNANKFTIFSQTKGVDSGVSYVALVVISGEISSVGIKDFQYSFIIQSKSDDPKKYLIEAELGRIWKDSDGLSEPRTSI
jgi:hypothetical protein